jgi:hypothetical protein
MVVDDWVGHINRLIVASAYTEHSIVNFDETNVDFDPSYRNTLCKIGEKSISLQINGHSGQCTVMLGCSAGWHKFPPFIIRREFDKEQFIGTVGCKSLSRGRCTPYNHQNGWMDRHSTSGYIE